MKHLELKCSCCGYIPDDEDIIKTGYILRKCDCGQENVCDLCLGRLGEGSKLSCPVCNNLESGIGSERKFYLSDEY